MHRYHRGNEIDAELRKCAVNWGYQLFLPAKQNNLQQVFRHIHLSIINPTKKREFALTDSINEWYHKEYMNHHKARERGFYPVLFLNRTVTDTAEKAERGTMNQTNFMELGLSEPILRALKDMGFEYATDIQAQSIPLIQAGYDVVGRSQTGTGKTAAFGIPAIEKIVTKEEKRSVQVLLLCPTRELAVQAAEEIKKISRYTEGIKAVAVYGGAPIDRQILQLRSANIVIGTPGRVMDHMRRHTLKLQNLKMVILDEADEMLSMGFREDIETILQETPEDRQTILFSATMPKEIMEIIRNYQNEPQIVEINKKQVTLDAIGQYYYEVPMGRKNDMLQLLLADQNPKRAIIFSNTKKMVEDLTQFLNENGLRADGIHGDMKQSQRTSVMNSFKSGRTSILVATDVAARGIDVDDIDCVINYDIPQNNEYYVHRIGRTGRAGKSGNAFTICSGRRQIGQMKDIAKAVRSNIEQLEIPTAQSILKKKRLEKQGELIHMLDTTEQLPYLELVSELMKQGYAAEQVAAAALQMMYGTEEEKLPVIQMEKKRRSGDFSKLMINIGRSSRIAPNFIVGAIAERTTLSGRDIGKIEIYDEHTLVEVPKQEEEQVLTAMEGCKINGLDTVTRKWFTKEDKEKRSDRRDRSEFSSKERAPREEHSDKRGKRSSNWDKKPYRENRDSKSKNGFGHKSFKNGFKDSKRTPHSSNRKSSSHGRSKKYRLEEE